MNLPSERCDEACYYHCTKAGTQKPDCIMTAEEIQELYRGQLQEMIDDIGFDEVKKMIDDLEVGEAERIQEANLGDGWDAGFADNN